VNRRDEGASGEAASMPGLRPSGPGRCAGGSGGKQPPAAGHVVGERVPQGDRLGLVDAAHQEAGEATVAGLGDLVARISSSWRRGPDRRK
jgi:hypothetical protein